MKVLQPLKLLLAAGLLASCAATPTSAPVRYESITAVPAIYAGALSYPERLRPVPGDAGAWRWRDPDVDFRQYQSLLVERIRIKLNAASPAADSYELKALTDYFHAAIDRAFAPPYAIARAPGRGVLRVRITIVDLVATNPEVSVAMLVTAYATIPDTLSSSATWRPADAAPYLGRTGIAVQFIDGAADRVVAEFADVQFGRKYDVNAIGHVTSAVTSGVTNYVDAYSTWAFTQQAFDRWSLQLRRRLDQIYGRASG